MTVIFPSPVFGPVHSRRLGVSLGVNLLPDDGKICTFDCIYCECGFNAERRPHNKIPTREQVVEALECKLKEMQKEGVLPDVITFAGNGEPTLHPDFSHIIDDVLRLRDTYSPKAKVSVLSNSSMIVRESVFDALMKVDNNILKLDTVSADYISLVDRPVSAYHLDDIVKGMQRFNGHCIVQTMFMRGEFEGRSVDNTGDEFVLPWIETVKRISPSSVMIYTIDRETPASGLKKATPEQLDRIVEMLTNEGIKASASY